LHLDKQDADATKNPAARLTRFAIGGQQAHNSM
jgi:hypothetical protein